MQARSSCSISWTWSETRTRLSPDLLRLSVNDNYHVGQSLVLHGHHPDKYLIALHLEAALGVRHVQRRRVVVQQRIYDIDLPLDTLNNF